MLPHSVDPVFLGRATNIDLVMSVEILFRRKSYSVTVMVKATAATVASEFYANG